MNEILILQKSFEDFNHAVVTLREAYASLEQRFENINRELEESNLELKRTITEKEEVKNYLQNILESLTTGVVVVDGKERIQTINRCAGAFLETSHDNLRGRHIGAIFESAFLKICKDPRNTPQKVKMRGRTLEIAGSPLHARDGEFIGTVFILRDITKIEQLEEVAKRAEKLMAMGEMAANIAHEIRNPLGSIELFASLLMKDLKEKRKRNKVAQIVTLVKNLDNKIGNLLLFAISPSPLMRRVSIHKILKEILLFSGQIIDREDISLSVKYANRDPIIYGDPEMLKQVFLNLILNALQAMPGGGNLCIETGCPASVDGNLSVEIIFSDTGIGIPKEDTERIFEPFFGTREGCCGVGLTVVHNIVTMHGGHVRVENGAQGGAVFNISFPLCERDS